MSVVDAALHRVIAGEAERFVAYLRSLSEDAWTQPSGLGDWTICEAAAHVTATCENGVMFIDRALAGITDPAPGRQTLQGDALSASLAARAKTFVAKYPDVVGSLHANATRLADMLAGLSAQDFQLPVWRPTGVTSVRRIAQGRVAELALHHWDLRRALGDTSSLNAEVVEVLLDWLSYWLNDCFRAAAPLDTPTTFTFALRDAENQHIIVYGDRYILEPSEPPDVTIRCDAGDYILLATGRLVLADTASERRLEVEGPLDLASTFQTWFKAI